MPEHVTAQTKQLERLLLWASVLGLFSTSAIAYVRLRDVVAAAPQMNQRLTQLEMETHVGKAVNDERWDDIKDRLERIEHKLDRRNNGR